MAKIRDTPYVFGLSRSKKSGANAPDAPLGPPLVVSSLTIKSLYYEHDFRSLECSE